MVLSLDNEAQVPVVETSLLRSLRIFQELPGAALEGLARSLERLEVGAGAVVIEQGDEGRHDYAIADGELEVWRDGERVPLPSSARHPRLAMMVGWPYTSAPPDGAMRIGTACSTRREPRRCPA